MKKNLFLFLFMAFLSAVNAQSPVFFTQTGGGSLNGTSWANAYPASQFTTVVNTAGDKKIYLAAGNYSITANINISRNFYLKGGYPANPSGTDTSAFNPSVNVSRITSAGNFKFDGGNLSSGAVIRFQGLELTGFSTSGNGAVVSYSAPGTNALSVSFVQLNVHGNTSSGSAGFAWFASVTGANKSIFVDRCYFENNRTSGAGDGGVFTFSTVYVNSPGGSGGVAGGSNNPFVIQNSSFISNVSTDDGGVFYLTTVADVDIKNNYFCNNSSADDGVIHLTTTNRTNISGNQIKGSATTGGTASGVYMTTVGNPGNIINNNTFFGGITGKVDIAGNASPYILISGNKFDKANQAAAITTDGSNMTLTGNTYNVTTNPGDCPTAQEVLPVDFGVVAATVSNKKLQVSWQTLTETNNDRFEIEGSKDGKSFTKIGEVKSLATDGNSSSALSYSFNLDLADTAQFAGLLFLPLALGLYFSNKKRLKRTGVFTAFCGILLLGFSACNKNEAVNNDGDGRSLFIRIKQIDKDGGYEYSKTVKVITK